MRTFLCAFAPCLFITIGGCATRHLPPPAMPARVAPTVVTEVPPTREGEGQVTLDVVDGPARAELVTARTQTLGMPRGYPLRPRGALPYGLQLTSRPLCVTPCTVTLPYGDHELLFSALDPHSERASTGFIHVGRQPSVARHAMGFQDAHVGGLIGAVVLIGVGAASLLAGSFLLAMDGLDDDGRRDLAPAGWAVAGTGAALTTLGVVIGQLNRPEDQPGATVQWTP